MERLRLAIPKGRLYEEVRELLEDSGIRLKRANEEYRPTISLEGFEAKILKPRNIAQLVSLSRFHIGFTGRDWLVEENADAEILLETGFDRVEIVVAAPKGVTLKMIKEMSKAVVATEYPHIAERWLKENGIEYLLLRTYGATEVFPPEDADVIIDNTASGRTLAVHNLTIVAKIMESETVLAASRAAMENEDLRRRIEEFVLLLRSALLARRKVLLEMNVPKDVVDEMLPKLPCMRAPTVAPLFGGDGFAVKIAVDEDEAIKLIPKLKDWGATDILQYRLERILP